LFRYNYLTHKVDKCTQELYTLDAYIFQLQRLIRNCTDYIDLNLNEID